MGTGPIFCCYVLKMRMSSFLQNGACPHFFAFYFGSIIRLKYYKDWQIIQRPGGFKPYMLSLLSLKPSQPGEIDERKHFF